MGGCIARHLLTVISDLKDDWGHAKNCTGCGKCVQACPTEGHSQRRAMRSARWSSSDAVSRLDSEWVLPMAPCDRAAL